MVLVNTPVAAPFARTSTFTKQVAPVARETPAMLNDPDPGAVVTATPQVLLSAKRGVATTNPVGSVSVKPTPVRFPKVGKPGSGALGLEMAMCNRVVRPGYRGGTGGKNKKSLVIVGGFTGGSGVTVT